MVRLFASCAPPHPGGSALSAHTVLGMALFKLWNMQGRSAIGLLQRPFGGRTGLGMDRWQVVTTHIFRFLGVLAENFHKIMEKYKKIVCIRQKIEYNIMEEDLQTRR